MKSPGKPPSARSPSLNQTPVGVTESQKVNEEAPADKQSAMPLPPSRTRSEYSEPDTVSPVFAELTRYVQVRYKDANELVRLLIFSVAYTVYSKRKKDSIKQNISLFRRAHDDDSIRYPHRVFNDPVIFAELCDSADKTVGSFVADEAKRYILETSNVFRGEVSAVIDQNKKEIIREIKESRHGVLREGFGHFATLSVASGFTVIFIIVVALIKAKNPFVLTESIGQGLIDLGTSIKDLSTAALRPKS